MTGFDFGCNAVEARAIDGIDECTIQRGGWYYW